MYFFFQDKFNDALPNIIMLSLAQVTTKTKTLSKRKEDNQLVKYKNTS